MKTHAINLINNKEERSKTSTFPHLLKEYNDSFKFKLLIISNLTDLCRLLLKLFNTSRNSKKGDK